jgi:purine-nucleoside phosphorylase
VSDDIPGGAALTADERQSTFDEMIRLGLDTAIGAA